MTNQEVFNKLRERYSIEELADSVMVSEAQSIEEETETNGEFAELLTEFRKNKPPQEKMHAKLLSIKYRIKSYLEKDDFSEEFSLGEVLKLYLKAVGRSQKELANEIGLHPSRINRIIKGKERIGKSIAYRLENHSGEVIPAIFWWKLLQKEIEQEILTEKVERELEKKYVSQVAYEA